MQQREDIKMVIVGVRSPEARKRAMRGFMRFGGIYGFLWHYEPIQKGGIITAAFSDNFRYERAKNGIFCELMVPEPPFYSGLDFVMSEDGKHFSDEQKKIMQQWFEFDKRKAIHV
jgi:hypothetical protein